MSLMHHHRNAYPDYITSTAPTRLMKETSRWEMSGEEMSRNGHNLSFQV